MKAFSKSVIKNKLFSHLRQLFLIGICCCTIPEPAHFIINYPCWARFNIASQMRSLGRPAKLWVLARSTWTARLEYAQQRPGLLRPHSAPGCVAATGRCHAFPAPPHPALLRGQATWCHRFALWVSSATPSKLKTTRRKEKEKKRPQGDTSFRCYLKFMVSEKEGYPSELIWYSPPGSIHTCFHQSFICRFLLWYLYPEFFSLFFLTIWSFHRIIWVLYRI